ncbi:hypothetical protein ACLOJK_026863 [Asimina triloba]
MGPLVPQSNLYLSFHLALSVAVRMSGRKLITPEDLNMIREGYNIPSTEVLWAFNVPLACVAPHSWKVIQIKAWYYENRGCLVNQYLWRELLTRRWSQGHVEFLARRDVKGIVDPLECMPRWEAKFFFARLVSERDIWGIPEQWEESFPDLIPRSRSSTTFRWHPSREELFHWCELVHFMVAEEGERHAPKRVHPLGEEGNLSGSGPSVRRASGPSSSRRSTPVAESEGMTPPSVVPQLEEELEASRAEVAWLQLMLQGDVARPSAVVEYV